MSTETLVALATAAAAALLAVAAILYCVLAIRRERGQRRRQVKEVAWESMGGAATKDELRTAQAGMQARLSEVSDRLAVLEAELQSRHDELDAALQARLSEVSDCLARLEAEGQSRHHEPHSTFAQVLRRWERRR